MSHPNPGQLREFAIGNLSADTTEAIATHLEDCPDCAQTVAQFDDAADTLVSQLAGSAPVVEFDSESALQGALAFVKEFGREPSQALPAPAPSANRPAPLGRLREYELLAKLGEGGMGAVYKARHAKLDKIVALKVLPADRMRSPEAVARFEREMRAVGKLDHPHIVRATDAGEVDGTHFLVMEYVAGCDLADLVKHHGPLPIADACELVRQAALGLAYAHEHGLVHRDIKPSNFMLAGEGLGTRGWGLGKGKTSPALTHDPSSSPQSPDPSPSLKILDLGLALLADEPTTGRELTSSGQMMGTVDYMAPEQAHSSHTVDQRADLYSLGATLYKLLTGAAPFSGPKYQSNVQKLVAIATETPIYVATHRPEVPADLSTLIDRLLAKNPADRPASAAQVAALLAPFAAPANLSFLTLPSGEGGRRPGEGSLHSQTAPTTGTLSFSPHLPLPLGEGRGEGGSRRWLVALALGSLAALVAFGVWIIIKDKDGKEIARFKADGPVTVEVTPETPEAPVAPTPAQPAESQSAAPKPLAYGPPIPAPKPVVLDLKPEPVDHKAGNPLRPTALVARPAPLPEVLSWTIELRQPRDYVRTLALSPDGKQLATGSGDGIVRIWDAASGKLVKVFVSRSQTYLSIESLSWSASGKYLAASQPDKIRVWEVATGAIVKTFSGGQTSASAWSPDGQFLAFVSQNVRVLVWDGLTNSVVRTLTGAKKELWTVAWSPLGTQIAAGSGDGTALIWDFAGDSATQRPNVAPSQILAVGTGAVRSVAWSPDGKVLATTKYGNDYPLSLWNAKTWDLMRKMEKFGSPVVWSHDGRFLRSAKSGSIDLHSGSSQMSDNPNAESRVFSLDDRKLFTGQSWGLIFISDLSTPSRSNITGLHPSVGRVAWVPNEMSLLVSYYHNANKTFSWSSERARMAERLPENVSVQDIALAPDGQSLALAVNQKIHLWNLKDKKLGKPFPCPAKCEAFAWAADSKQLASIHSDHKVRLWDTKTAVEVASLDCPLTIDGSPGIAWSPTGERLALCRGNPYSSGLWLWDLKTMQPILSAVKLPRSKGIVNWNPAGTELVAAGQLFNGADGKFFPAPVGNTLDWHAKGTRLTNSPRFTYTAPRIVSDSPSHSQPFLHQHEGEMMAGKVSPDGATAATGDLNGFTWTWDTSTCQPLAVLFLLGNGEPCAINADGHYRCDGDLGAELVYVVQTAAGQQTYSPAEFAAKFGWKNDPAKVRLTAPAE